MIKIFAIIGIYINKEGKWIFLSLKYIYKKYQFNESLERIKKLIKLSQRFIVEI
ncbi:hypothetical protein SDC9_198025 [bioreactor metagenome]|uniref:Uncharacterized protein n=1 Tax=bioreactor metagenome TaxID=1076179 RepID=A0A645IIT9_9ZZZZ